MNPPKKRIIRIAAFIIIGILITAVLTTAFLYSKYINKKNNLVLLSNDSSSF